MWKCAAHELTSLLSANTCMLHRCLLCHMPNLSTEALHTHFLCIALSEFTNICFTWNMLRSPFLVFWRHHVTSDILSGTQELRMQPFIC